MQNIGPQRAAPKSPAAVKAEATSAQAAYIDFLTKSTVESIARAAAEHRHGKDQIIITYHAGEIRQIEIVPSTVYKF